jgi:RNA polymerase sigma-70 factor, ECF subfamily
MAGSPQVTEIIYNSGVSLFRSARKPDFETAVRPELPLLYRVGRRMAGSAEEAEDLLQQTLMKGYRGWSKFDGSYLRSWLVRIMRNELAYAKRKESSAPPMAELDEGIAGEDGLWDSVAWRDQARRVLEELDRLPEEYRLAVTLCDVEEMSYEEAAEAMDVPIGTVRSRVSRGRALIRQRMTRAVTARDGSAR